LKKAIGILSSVSMGMALFLGYLAGTSAQAAAVAPPLQGTRAARNQPAKGDPVRGSEIFYLKCNMCHSKTAAFGPLLDDLYKRSKLVSGKPVNDETVTDKIMNEGGEKMPAFRYTLSPADLADLLSYLREGKCCPDPDNPPPNPRYRAP